MSTKPEDFANYCSEAILAAKVALMEAALADIPPPARVSRILATADFQPQVIASSSSYTSQGRMSRSRGSSSAADDYGMRSPHAHMCDRCDHQINDYKHDAVKQRGRWIHKGCAGGADDDQGNPVPKPKLGGDVPRSEWWSND